MPKKCPVTLTPEERETLQALIANGTSPARTLTHARILLKADSERRPAWSNAALAEKLEVSEPTISRVRKRFAEGGLEAALHRKHPDRQWECRLDGAQEAHLIALSCSEPPEGRERWRMRLLAEAMAHAPAGREEGPTRTRGGTLV